VGRTRKSITSWRKKQRLLAIGLYIAILISEKGSQIFYTNFSLKNPSIRAVERMEFNEKNVWFLHHFFCKTLLISMQFIFKSFTVFCF
jgi:hypothetical protein